MCLQPSLCFCFSCEHASQNPTHHRPMMTGNNKIFPADLYEMGLPLFLNHGQTLSLFSALFVPGIFQSVIFILVGQLDFSVIGFFSHRLHPSLSSISLPSMVQQGARLKAREMFAVLSSPILNFQSLIYHLLILFLWKDTELLRALVFPSVHGDHSACWPC